MANQQSTYGNDSISMLKGAERVRKRPGVIFGSDGLDGCEHSVFEILSNSIDEAREGYGKRIIVTRYADGSFEVEDFGRGIPLDFNTKEKRYNWELVFCEMYAGGKYTNDRKAKTMSFRWALNGLGVVRNAVRQRIYGRHRVRAITPSIRCILKKAKTSAVCTKSRTPASAPAPDSALEAGSGGFHGHQCAGRLLSGRAETAGRSQCRALNFCSATKRDSV